MNTRLTSLLTTAIITGLLSSQTAHAEDTGASKASGDQMAVEKNSCKGHKAEDKNSCKSMNGMKKKKKDKNSCKNGCGEAKGSKEETQKSDNK